MKPVKIVIPENIEGAVTELNGVGALLTATEWKKAAIVYAFTHDGGQGRSVTKESRNASFSISTLSCNRFAVDLKIQGLRSHETVEEYRGYWKEAIEKGEAVHIQPGDEVTLPTSPFPPSPRLNGLSDAAPLKAKVRAAKKLLAQPEVAEAMEPTIVEMVGKDPILTNKVLRVNEEHHPAPVKKEKAQTGWDWLVGIGVASEVVATLQQTRDEVIRLAGYLENHWREMDPNQKAVVQEILDSYQRARGMITEYEELIQQATGLDSSVIGRNILERMEDR